MPLGGVPMTSETGNPSLRPPVPEFRVREASFVRSAPSLEALGAPERVEIAFLGRSNVGKSSLLNVLLERAKLVRVSREPGRTRDVNLFSVEVLRIEGEARHAKQLHLVDLPGYGYAKASQQERARMSRLVSGYLSTRSSLVAACQLFDVRHAPSAADRDVHEQLRGASYLHLRIGTKCDKIVLSKRKAAQKDLAKALSCLTSEVVLFSSVERIGREHVWSRLWEVLPDEP